jgi:hypothetical protein
MFSIEHLTSWEKDSQNLLWYIICTHIPENSFSADNTRLFTVMENIKYKPFYLVMVNAFESV